MSSARSATARVSGGTARAYCFCRARAMPRLSWAIEIPGSRAITCSSNGTARAKCASSTATIASCNVLAIAMRSLGSTPLVAGTLPDPLTYPSAASRSATAGSTRVPPDPPASPDALGLPDLPDPPDLPDAPDPPPPPHLTHPTHPTHPTPPTHPTHPTYPTHPTHPTHQARQARGTARARRSAPPRRVDDLRRGCAVRPERRSRRNTQASALAPTGTGRFATRRARSSQAPAADIRSRHTPVDRQSG